MRLSILMRLAVLVCVVLATVPDIEAADRDKLLSEPGVYGTFATFSLDADWGKQDQVVRIAQLTVLKGVVEQHREKIAIDLYLLRDTQTFLIDLQQSQFGKHLTTSAIMHGLTKKANYVPAFPDQMKADLKVASEPGPMPYAIVIPIRKSADWWGLDQNKRAAMMQEHTEASLPYNKTVKRKLYHSTGLDDLDFITYFETSKLEDFHSLILAMEKVKEFPYNRRFGHPTLIGTVKSLDEIIEILAQ